MSKAKQQPKGTTTRSSDLQDPVRDQEKLENEDVRMDLPDVKDIPGQEYIHPPNPAEYTDTTISSSDEEGENVWTDDEITQNSSDVSGTERKLLDDSANDMPTKDEQSLRRASLDSTDNEGEPLNEKASSNAISG